MEINLGSQDKFTVAGTNIEEVKRQNAQSGLTFNELNELFEGKSVESSADIGKIDNDEQLNS